MSDLILYTRPGCHLCDDALQVCRDSGITPELVDISGDLGLLRAYGNRIPVIQRRDTGAELGWPFDATSLGEFFSARPRGRG